MMSNEESVKEAKAHQQDNREYLYKQYEQDTNQNPTYPTKDRHGNTVHRETNKFKTWLDKLKGKTLEEDSLKEQLDKIVEDITTVNKNAKT